MYVGGEGPSISAYLTADRYFGVIANDDTQQRPQQPHINRKFDKYIGNFQRLSATNWVNK